ncbi:MAG: alpha/beta fold hydrolase [Crocinitomicaceae bacterium]|nr:alpha/beta fold hydrolase [Crocinitomicaceae bacterium]
MLRIIYPFIFIFMVSSCSMNMFYYFPDKNPVEASPLATDHYIEYKEGKNIHGLFFQKENPVATVFILHGNAGSLTGWQSVSEMFWEEGYQSFIIDYPEFGNSDGKAKHNQVIESSQKAFDYFLSLPEVEGTKKIVLGFSLGGNLALKVATENQDKIDALVVEGAFTNYRDIGIASVPKILRFAPWMVLGNKFKGEELIRDFKKPILVVHSTEDEVIPYKMGEEIYKNAGSIRKELWTIKGLHLQGFGLHPTEYFYKIRNLLVD